LPDQDHGRTVAALLDQYGRTFAAQAGITLADKPRPLYHLLVVSTLLSVRISADIAVAAARELFRAGYGTPRRMLEASWQDRVAALGRGHYRRYDERTATMLGDAARLCQQRWRGDLRRLHAQAPGDVAALRRLLTEFPGIGPTGADIFLREVQGVWPDVAPFFDTKTRDGAKRLHLPATGDDLATLVPAARLPNLAAALIQVTRDGRDGKAAAAVRASAAGAPG
jgi:endonuclease III